METRKIADERSVDELEELAKINRADIQRFSDRKIEIKV